MRRIEQTRTGEDGNCLAACMASILEVPLDEVPEFDDDWLDQLNDFLAGHRLSYERRPIDGVKPVGWGTIEGVSPRGGLHACVAKDGELIWDPHPISDGTGQGLVEPRYYGVLKPILGQTAKEKKVLSKRTLDASTMRPGGIKRGPGAFTVQTTNKDGSVQVEPVSVLRTYDDFGSQIKRNAAVAKKRSSVMARGTEPIEVRELRSDIASRKRALSKLSGDILLYAQEKIMQQEEKLRRLTA